MRPGGHGPAGDGDPGTDVPPDVGAGATAGPGDDADRTAHPSARDGRRRPTGNGVSEGVRAAPGGSPPVGMFTRCIRCHADLGRNRALEGFPVGERIAYDLEKGRLWVVCPACRRWNLSPLLSRWEAMEEAERRFRGTQRRVSTENIGLARLEEGLELVRVGDPLREEFAAWRYADSLGRRRRKMLLWAGTGATAAGAVWLGGLALGLAAGTAVNLIHIPRLAYWWTWNRRVVARIPAAGDGEVDVRGSHLQRTRLRRAEGDRGWRLIVPHEEGESELTGRRALNAAGTLLAHANRWGAGEDEVETAVRALEAHDGPADFYDAALKAAARDGHGYTPITGLPRKYLVPLEMAAHEEEERRALEGELEELERAWREAEEIAAIADDMFLPEWMREWIRRERRRLTG